MIISNNRKPSWHEFSKIVFGANDWLNKDAACRNSYYATRNAQKLEDDVIKALTQAAIGTPFENTIQKVSGQKFPDIVAGKYYGVEVKSSKDENWVTLGGSINESTRVEDVERIFLTFGKLVPPIEFRSKPYEDCLSEVIVTHYPRYKINMNLTKGETIFDKMNINYDELRLNHDPVKRVVEYYKSQLRDGESLWWIDTSDNVDRLSEAASIKVRLWRTLTSEEKKYFVISAYAFFPDILSDSSTKYENFSLWLVSRYGIVSTSMRDAFSAGGQKTIITPNSSFEKVPQVIYKINQYKEEIIMKIISADESSLKDSWKVSNLEKDRINQWIKLLVNNYSLKNHNIETILKAIFINKKSR